MTSLNKERKLLSSIFVDGFVWKTDIGAKRLMLVACDMEDYPHVFIFTPGYLSEQINISTEKFQA